MQKERAIDLSLIRQVDISTSAIKGKITLRSLFKEYLKKLNVGFYDPCCNDAATCPPISAQPLNVIQCNPDGLYVAYEDAGGGGSVVNVGLTMPAAFSVAGSPVTTTGTLAVTMTGTTSEYLRGDGTLATLPVYTANNGLTMLANNIQLGGSLTKDTFITNAGFRLSASNNTVVPTIQGNNSSSGPALEGNNTGTGNGVLGTALSGVGGAFSSNSSFGVTAQSNTSTALITSGTLGAQMTAFNTSVLNNSITLLRINRSTGSSNPSNGVGGSLDFLTHTSTLTDRVSTSLVSRWTTVIDANRTSQFEIWGINDTNSQQHFTLKGTGQLQLNNYGDNIFTGTLTKYLAVDVNGNVIEADAVATNFWVAGTAGTIHNTASLVGIGTTMTNPTALLHIAAGTTVVPQLKFEVGSIVTVPQDGAVEYDGTNLYFTVGSTRKVFPLGTTDTTIYDGDGIIAGPRIIDAAGFSVTWDDVGLFRIVEGDVTVGGTYDFNNGVDFLVYDAANSSNLALNSVTGLSFEYTDVITTSLITSLIVDGTGIKMTNIDEFADNAAAIAGGLTAGYVYRTGDALKIVH